MYKRAGGSVKIFRRRLFVSQCRKTPGGSPLVFHHLQGSKKVGEQGTGRGGGEYQDFPSKNFCLTVPKTVLGSNPLVFH